MHQQIALDTVPETHPVAAFAQFWQSAAPANGAPPWQAFDPVAHPAVLPWVLLHKPEADGRLRCVICGEGCTETFGFSYRGQIYGEGLPDDAAEFRRQELDRVLRSTAPQYSKTIVPFENREYINVYRGIFPFLAADGSLERMMVVIAPVDTIYR